MACRMQMPRVPDVFLVQRGTNMTQEEVDFLTGKGFIFVSRNRTESNDAYPTEAQIKVMVDAYPEKVMEQPRDYRFKTRRGKGCRQKSTHSASCLTRLERARSASIRVLHSSNVSTGNGYGMLFRVASGERPEESIYIKLHSIMALLSRHNDQYAAALREIIILSIDLEESRKSNRHANEELQIYREDFNKRITILDGVVNDHGILDELLLERFKALVHQTGKHTQRD
ncbi:hypothetical protein R1sor_024890 [Riccia sorocarpa]|uniref:Uncharacterized protein n=1 Tax=Riccia sorocarpa TaxID=122646 RepID=A0ABD3GXT6_9MARC